MNRRPSRVDPRLSSSQVLLALAESLRSAGRRYESPGLIQELTQPRAKRPLRILPPKEKMDGLLRRFRQVVILPEVATLATKFLKAGRSPAKMTRDGCAVSSPRTSWGATWGSGRASREQREASIQSRQAAALSQAGPGRLTLNIPLKKGTGPECKLIDAPEDAAHRGACPLVQRTLESHGILFAVRSAGSRKNADPAERLIHQGVRS